MMGDKPLSSQERKTIRQTNKPPGDPRNGKVHSTKRAWVYIEELGTYLCLKLVEDSPSVLSLGRLCDELTRRKPHTNKKQQDHHVLCRKFRSSRRGHSAGGRLVNLPGTTPTKETLCQMRNWRIPRWSCWNLSLKMDAKGIPYCGTRTSFGCNRCGERSFRQRQKSQRDCDKESKRFKNKRNTTMRSCICRMTKTSAQDANRNLRDVPMESHLSMMSREVITGILSSYKTDTSTGRGITLQEPKMRTKQHLV